MFVFLKKNLVKILAFIFLMFSFTALNMSAEGTFTSGPDSGNIYCANPEDCTMTAGENIVKNNINDIEKDRKFSVYVQDIAGYVIFFIAILGVLYIIYAGFIIVTSAGDEGKVKKSKTSIMYVLIGIIVIFLAFPIIKWIITLVNTA